ncbi:MAG: type II secretion system F family protein [Pseudomonadota bacterium]
MAVFSYIALSEAAAETSGVVNAGNRAEALRILRARGLAPLEIESGTRLSDSADGSARGGFSWRNPFRLRQYFPVSSLDRIVFFRQMTLMLRAGYTILEAIDTAAEISDKNRLRKALRDISNRLQAGATLSQSMQNHPRLFSTLTSNLIASGEASGELDVVLERISEGMERRMEVRRDLVTSMIYPSIVFTLAVFVMYYAIAVVVPRFVFFLSARDISLPAITQFMVDLSNWFQVYGTTLIITLAVLIFFALAAYTFPVGKRIIDAIILRLPIIGTFQVSANMADLGWITQMLLQSRITVMESMRVLSDVTSHSSYKNIYSDAADRVLGGEPLSNGFKKNEVPVMVKHLIEVGEKTGDLDGVMAEIGNYYAMDLRMRTKRMIALIEPAMLLFVGGVVALIYFSIFSAVWKAATLGR